MFFTLCFLLPLSHLHLDLPVGDLILLLPPSVPPQQTHGHSQVPLSAGGAPLWASCHSPAPVCVGRVPSGGRAAPEGLSCPFKEKWPP